MESSVFAAPKIVVVTAEEAQEVLECVLATILKITLKNITIMALHMFVWVGFANNSSCDE